MIGIGTPAQVAGADVMIGVTQPGGLEGHQDLAILRPVEFDLLDIPIAH